MDDRPATRRQGLSKGGIIEVQGPSGSQQFETYTCCHCNSIFLVPKNPTEMGFCNRCFQRECLRCGRELNGRCVPFEKTLLKMEQRFRFFKSVGV